MGMHLSNFSFLCILQENPTPVGWKSLLVIRNVPNRPTASTEVEKLIRRFGTVIKTLVISDMVRAVCQLH